MEQLSETLRRKSFLFSNSRQSIAVQSTNDDEAERAIHREESELEAKLSRLSIFQQSKVSDTSVANHSGAPLVDLQDHFQTCLRMFTTNKINNQNVWQLNIFDYISSVLKSDDEIRNILQVAGTTLDIGAKIYSLRVDDVHNEVLKLACALSSINVKPGEDNNEELSDQSDIETTEKKVKKKKKRNLVNDCDQRITVYPVDDPLNGPIKKENFFSNQCADSNDSKSLLNVQLGQKPGLSFQLMTVHLAKNYRWSESTEVKKSENKYQFNSSVLEPLPHNSICPAFRKFSLDQWVEEDEQALTSKREDRFKDFESSGVYLDPELDEPEPDQTLTSHIGCADYKQSEAVFITSMQPGNDETTGPQKLEYSYKSLPNISERFKITGVWAGPAHWKLKCLRRPDIKKDTEQKQKKKVVRTVKKSKPFEYKDIGIPEIKEMLKSSRKRTVRNVKNVEEKCTIPEYIEILEDRRVSLLTRPNVKITKARVRQSTDDLNVSGYEYDSPHDGEYCPDNSKMNNTGHENFIDENDENTPLISERGDDEQVQQQDSSFSLIEQPENLVVETFIPYAHKAKRMDMKQLKDVMWEEISETKTQIPNGKKSKKDGSPNDDAKLSTTLTKIYKDLPKKLSSTMSENLSVPLVFVALLHLANEHNLNLDNNDTLSEVFITQNSSEG